MEACDSVKVFDFGQAIKELKNGRALARVGWNGKGLFVVKQIPSKIEGEVVNRLQSLPESAKKLINSIFEGKGETPHIDYTNQMLIINPDGRADSWVPSVSDIFAEDWYIKL